MGNNVEGGRPLPAYKSHKVVHALKIASVLTGHEPNDSATLTFGAGYEPFRVDEDYVRKHEPKPGGYYVVYEDGYQSWSPAEAFESGYTKLDGGERLVDHEREMAATIENLGQQLWTLVDQCIASKALDPRCGALAKTKIDEAVMWAVKGLG